MIKKLFFLLLFPFALLYDLVTSIRNLLFDVKIIRSFSPPVFSVGVGNLTVGGTGKTPVSALLIEILEKYHPAVLSRGYGRTTRGFLEIADGMGPDTVGDEPKMLFDRYHATARFFVGEKRKDAAGKIMTFYPETTLLILDDVYQHRYINPALKILLCDYNRPFYRDYLLPAGRLREARRGAGRADIILVTKCPEFSNNSERNLIEHELRKYIRKDASVYFARFKPSSPVSLTGKILGSGAEVVLVSAIAGNKRFLEETSAIYPVHHHFSFPDHYTYTRADLDKILGEAVARPLITTEKDMVKIKPLLSDAERERLYIIPVRVEIERSEAFEKEVLTSFMRFSEKKSG